VQKRYFELVEFSFIEEKVLPSLLPVKIVAPFILVNASQGSEISLNTDVSNIATFHYQKERMFSVNLAVIESSSILKFVL
jgi:hypothetical protein